MGLLELLAPWRCGGCGAAGPSPCGPCVDAMWPAPPGRPPAGLDRCRAAVAYDGPARPLVAGLKYRNGRAALPWMATALAALVDGDAELDVVTWIPSAGAHRRTRGFDQGRLLAQHLGARLRLPARQLLVRRPGPPQTGRSLEQRRAARPDLVCAFPVAGGRVLLVDDVWTTGASLEAGAAALRGAGAGWVGAVTVARTPLKATPRDTEGNADGYGEPPSALWCPAPPGTSRPRASARRPRPAG